MSERKCATCGHDESVHGHMFGASVLMHGFQPEHEPRCRCGRLLVCDACTRKAPDALCAICGEDHDYEDHRPGSELRHDFEPESGS